MESKLLFKTGINFYSLWKYKIQYVENSLLIICVVFEVELCGNIFKY